MAKIEVIEKDVERQELERVKSNIKFFNVQEDEASAENCKQTVTDLLNTHYSEGEWSTDQFDAVFRLGKKENSRGARPILVKCKDVATARKILGQRKGRESMASKGIKIAQERTRRQDQTLRQLRDRGKNPFFSEVKSDSGREEGITGTLMGHTRLLVEPPKKTRNKMQA